MRVAYPEMVPGHRGPDQIACFAYGESAEHMKRINIHRPLNGVLKNIFTKNSDVLQLSSLSAENTFNETSHTCVTFFQYPH